MADAHGDYSTSDAPRYDGKENIRHVQEAGRTRGNEGFLRKYEESLLDSNDVSSGADSADTTKEHIYEYVAYAIFASSITCGLLVIFF